ncbi:hypothetical protein [Ignavibacterium sp.]|uniref:hypothetical protein n=1 Tax=Ignavibacterium sp. TaxID=2651167 RepID=UPI002201E932|nr:hypothetical protein [Ignavibacterium sp.]BDQ04428.1 MAG: hypothetical protein KatS3mg037_3003 [Ignavibacterium sp.]
MYLIIISTIILLNMCYLQLSFLQNNSLNRTNLIVQVDLIIYGDNGKFRLAKSFDKINTSEKFQFIVRSNSDVRLIMINKSLKDCKILTNVFINSNRNYYLPSPKEFFVFDGSNKTEEISLVIFKREFKLYDILLKPSLNCEEKWKLIDDQFNEFFTIKSKPVPPILQLSGNIRTSELSEELEVSNVLIKKYLFDVNQ